MRIKSASGDANKVGENRSVDPVIPRAPFCAGNLLLSGNRRKADPPLRLKVIDRICGLAAERGMTVLEGEKRL